MSSKSELRRQIAHRIGEMKAQDKAEQSAAVLAKLSNHQKYQQAKCISVYLSTESEIDTKPILERALNVDQKRCFIPYVGKTKAKAAPDSSDGNPRTRMAMVELKSIAEYAALPLNHYGIKEPHRESPMICERAAKLPEDQLDLVIVPGVAFTRDGQRLGHGKGYYDEFLATWSEFARKHSRNFHTIGLAFREQLADDVHELDGHDYKLDEVLFP